MPRGIWLLVECDIALLGREEDAAREWLTKHGWRMRVVQRDGQHMVVTRDVDMERLNVRIEKGIVAEVLSFG